MRDTKEGFCHIADFDKQSTQSRISFGSKTILLSKNVLYVHEDKVLVWALEYGSFPRRQQVYICATSQDSLGHCIDSYGSQNVGAWYL